MKKNSGLLGDAYQPRAKDVLSGRFIVPPFSVLNTREGFWQERKRQWINIGIQSEIGRGYELSAAIGDNLDRHKMMTTQMAARFKDASPGGSPRPAMSQKGHIPGQPITRGDGRGRPLLKRQAGTNGEGKSVFLHPTGGDDDTVLGGTSVFDPVLCELVYRWFAPPQGTILDPFAGGSVRGIVAGELGLFYTGIDLSQRQLEANRKQAEAIGTDPRPVWVHGNSSELPVVLKPMKHEYFDLVFSCPPYGDLEVYSEDERDISTMTPDAFASAYWGIIQEACKYLKPNAFAVFVVGDYRDKQTGYYRNFPALTCAAFEDQGLHLYNEIILLNAIGSLPLRINAQFNGSRKVGKCHQNVLVFAKGQPKDFVKGWGDVF